MINRTLHKREIDSAERNFTNQWFNLQSLLEGRHCVCIMEQLLFVVWSITINDKLSKPNGMNIIHLNIISKKIRVCIVGQYMFIPSSYFTIGKLAKETIGRKNWPNYLILPVRKPWVCLVEQFQFWIQLLQLRLQLAASRPILPSTPVQKIHPALSGVLQYQASMATCIKVFFFAKRIKTTNYLVLLRN